MGRFLWFVMLVVSYCFFIFPENYEMIRLFKEFILNDRFQHPFHVLCPLKEKVVMKVLYPEIFS